MVKLILKAKSCCVAGDTQNNVYVYNWYVDEKVARSIYNLSRALDRMLSTCFHSTIYKVK